MIMTSPWLGPVKCQTRWMDGRLASNESQVGRVGRAVVLLDSMEKGISDGNAWEGAGVSQWQ